MWYWAKNKMTLVLIRHGETLANKEQRYLGKTDESLSKSGIEQLLLYKSQRLYPDVDYLFTSPMKRCIETAKLIYPNLCPIVISEWKEIDFGRFEYKNYIELKDDIRYQAWIDSGGTISFPEGENRKDFILRCEKGFIKMCDILEQAIKQYTNKSGVTGAIVHGGTIMALLYLHHGKGKKDYFDYNVSNGRGYICKLSNDSQIEEILAI